MLRRFKIDMVFPRNVFHEIVPQAVLGYGWPKKIFSAQFKKGNQIEFLVNK